MEHLDTEQFDPVVFFTRQPGHAREMIREFPAGELSYVFAVGGDGTVNEVASALVNTPVVMGIIPMGSGNGLARHFRLPFSTGRILKLLGKGRVIDMDYGLMNGIPFFCTAGVGFDAYVGKLFAEEGSRGPGLYVRKALEALFHYHSLHYRLEIGRQFIETDAFLVTFANASQYGNEAIIAPAADVTDGMMDLVVLSRFPLVVAPTLGLRLFVRMIDKSRYVQIIRCDSARVHCPKEQMVVHYDGETALSGPVLDVKINKGGLKILVP